ARRARPSCSPSIGTEPRGGWSRSAVLTRPSTICTPSRAQPPLAASRSASGASSSPPPTGGTAPGGCCCGPAIREPCHHARSHLHPVRCLVPCQVLGQSPQHQIAVALKQL